MGLTKFLRKFPWQTILALLVLTNLIGLGLVYQRVNSLTRKFPFELLESNVRSQADILTKLGSLQNLLASGQSADSSPNVLGMADLLPDKVNNPATPASNFISVVDTISSSVPVYKEQADFSAILGQLVKDYRYPYFTRIDEWYLVGLENGQTGWVKAANVNVVE